MGTEVPMPLVPVGIQKEKTERMEFLLDIYPNGMEYSQLIDRVKKAYKISDTKAKEKSDKILAEMVEEGWISIKERRNGSKVVLLAKKGMTTISAYTRVLKENDKRRYFARLKGWMIAGDTKAKIVYARSAMEVFLQAPEIACMLVTPHYEAHLVDYYSRLTGKEANDDTRAFVMDYVGLLVGLGFAKMNKITDPQSSREVVSYYFLKDGIDVMRLIFKSVSGTGSSTSKPVAKPVSPVITWLAFLIAFLSIVFISVSVSSSLAMDTNSTTALIFVAFMASVFPTVIVFLLTKLGNLGSLLPFKKK